MSEFSELTWRCRRGVKELDLVLNFYMNTDYKKASKEEIITFKQLLDLEDPILYALFINDLEPINNEQKALLVKLQKYGKGNKA